MRTPRLALLALLALVSSAHGAPAQHPFRVAIAAGKIGEVCMLLQAGDILGWRFKASTTVDFNLHHHVEQQVLMPVERKATTEERAEHAIDQRNDWCLMWTAPPGRRANIEGAWSVRKAPAASAPP